MRTKEEVQDWLDGCIINDASVVAVDKWLSKSGYEDMEFSVGSKGENTFIDLINFCNSQPDSKEELQNVIDKIDSSIAVLFQEYSRLKKIIRKL